MYINGIGLVDAKAELNISGMRRAGRFAKLAVAAATAAVKDSSLSLSGTETGIILATAFGPHATTFEFLDNILTYSEKEVSPTLFSHSVHNAAAFYVAAALNATGPTLSVTDFYHPFYQALSLARFWLKTGMCKEVLVGKSEESGKVMSDIVMVSSRPEVTIQEGALFILLGTQDNAKPYRHQFIDSPFEEKDMAKVANSLRL